MELNPILLFGMPRSGTTWLGKVFDSHPHTLYRHEPDSGGALDAVVPLFPDPAEAPQLRAAVEGFVGALPRDRSLRVSGKLPLFPKAYRSPLAHLGHRAAVIGGKLASRWLPLREVPAFISADYRGPLPLVWKSIESLGRLGLFAAALPHARLVHIVRHPCGYVASVLGGEARGLLPGAVPASEDYGILEMLLDTPQARRRDLSLEELRSLRPEERLAWRWLLYNEKAMEEIAAAGNARTVRYEDLCRDPEGGYRGLFEFAGLSWHEQTDAFVRNSTSSEQAAYFSVFKDPERAAGGWRNKLDAGQQRAIMAVVRDSLPGRLYAEDAQPALGDPAASAGAPRNGGGAREVAA